MSESDQTSDKTDVFWITQGDQFCALRQPWNELVGERPFASWGWLSAWWDHWGRGRQLAIAIVVDRAGKWLGAAPWMIEMTSSGARVVRVIASGSVCSDYLGIVCRRGHEATVATALARSGVSLLRANGARSSPIDLVDVHGFRCGPSAARVARGGVDVLETEGRSEDDLATSELLDRIAEQGAAIHHSVLARTWSTDLPSSWEVFNAPLSKSFRRKTAKACQRINSSSFSIANISDDSLLGDVWPDFVRLHQSRRRMLGQAGCFADRRFKEFLRTATERMMADGLAELNVIRWGGQPIAASLIFRAGDCRYMYQSGIHPEAMAQEPGHLLNTFSIQQAISEGCTQFDFLRGDEPYKAMWGARPRTLWFSRLVPLRLGPRVRHAVWLAGEHVRGFLRSVRRQRQPARSIA